MATLTPGRPSVSFFISLQKDFGALTGLARFLALTGLLAVASALAQGATQPSSLQQVPVTVDGQSIRLQMRIYKPAGDGRFPTLVFHHGSMGYGTDSSRFKQAVDAPAVAAFFVQRG